MNIAGLIGAIGRKVKNVSSIGEQFLAATHLGELRTTSVLGSRQVAADEGSYFVSTNPTPGTAVASAVNASFDATKSFIAIRNKANASGKRVFVDYIKLIPTVAPASGTSMHYAVYVGPDALYTSGGTEYTPRNANGDSDESPVSTVVVTSGAAMLTTVAASTGPRARGVARSVIPAVLEEIVIRFGAEGGSGSSATAAGRSEVMAPPIIVQPGGVMLLNVWFPSNASTGISVEFEVGLIER